MYFVDSLSRMGGGVLRDGVCYLTFVGRGGVCVEFAVWGWEKKREKWYRKLPNAALLITKPHLESVLLPRIQGYLPLLEARFRGRGVASRKPDTTRGS